MSYLRHFNQKSEFQNHDTSFSSHNMLHTPLPSTQKNKKDSSSASVNKAPGYPLTRTYSNGATDGSSQLSVDAKFRGLKLDSYSALSVISTLSNYVEAIDLSHNRIEELPSVLPKSIIGLNLSHNKIQLLTSHSLSKDISHLIELNLSHNQIAR